MLKQVFRRASWFRTSTCASMPLRLGLAWESFSGTKKYRQIIAANCHTESIPFFSIACLLSLLFCARLWGANQSTDRHPSKMQLCVCFLFATASRFRNRLAEERPIIQENDQDSRAQFKNRVSRNWAHLNFASIWHMLRKGERCVLRRIHMGQLAGPLYTSCDFVSAFQHFWPSYAEGLHNFNAQRLVESCKTFNETFAVGL